MTVARDVSEKLIALGNWLAEARRELERELDSQGTPATPAEVVHRDWCSMRLGSLNYCTTWLARCSAPSMSRTT